MKPYLVRDKKGFLASREEFGKLKRRGRELMLFVTEEMSGWSCNVEEKLREAEPLSRL
jgi:hypothetical protein